MLVLVRTIALAWITHACRRRRDRGSAFVLVIASILAIGWSWRSRWRRRRFASWSYARGSGCCDCDLDTFGLTPDGFFVDVPLPMVVDGTSVEDLGALVCELAVAVNIEPGSCW